MGVEPVFGDHKMVTFSYDLSRHDIEPSIRRSWRGYSKTLLLNELHKVDWSIKYDSVQSYWNCFENKLVKVVDRLCPLSTFISNSDSNTTVPQHIKNKLNIRRRLLSKLKTKKCSQIKMQIKKLDKEIRFFFHSSKAKSVRRNIIPGNSSSLWRAVKVARDVDTNDLPRVLFEGGVEVEKKLWPDRFAEHFDNKIKNLLGDISLDDQVYNGRKVVNAVNKNFMDYSSVLECIKSLKTKNSEGYDRIPQRVLVDGVDVLLDPLHGLFRLIYETKLIPDQWKVAKTVPIYKNKGDRNNMENYRPIANLCSSSKIFEKLILKRINEIQAENNTDITGENQHGFKQKRSTSTLSVKLQSLIARALDEDKYVLVASLDLSSAFDVVNINLLIK